MPLSGVFRYNDGSGELPAGVTLQEIDGGPNYYSDHGFTFAYNNGWDNPSFFPIGVWQYPMVQQSNADLLLDLHINFVYGMNADGSLSRLRSNNLSLIVQSNELSTILAGNGGSLGTETVGILTFDEPGTSSQWKNPIQTVANVSQDHRFWTIQLRWEPIAWPNDSWDLDGENPVTALATSFSTPNATTRHVDVGSSDQYWMTQIDGDHGAFYGGGIYSLGTAPSYRDMTLNEMQRPCHYGDMVDEYRALTTTFPGPIGQFIENGGPYDLVYSDATYIQNGPLNAAVWASIIHGARMLFYFNHTFDTGGPVGISFNNFEEAYFQTTHNGQALSMYDQVKATNALVLSLATVINSPFAIGFVTVSPAAVKVTNSVADSGFDVMAKYHNVAGGDNKFYVFAMGRYAQGTTNQVATFTIKNTGASTVTVINESRTITITDGGTQFVDTFATANTVHIYRIG